MEEGGKDRYHRGMLLNSACTGKIQDMQIIYFHGEPPARSNPFGARAPEQECPGAYLIMEKDEGFYFIPEIMS